MPALHFAEGLMLLMLSR